ncbi:hypothetical protein L5D93_13090 [Paenibacillus thiaminolyticus]|nr:hypothetical protein [Paenibacillus thiaminolyticus]
MKKIMGICLAMVLILSLSSVSFAGNHEVKVVSAQEVEYGDEEFTIFDAKLIDNVNHTGKGAYTGLFTCSENNGKKLNIYVKNNNSSGTVKFSVSQTSTDTDYGVEDVGPGKGKTRTFTMPSGAGVSGDWKVYVYTEDGHEMDINVNARQF